MPQVYLNGEKVPVDTDKHLGKFMSTKLADRNITENVCDLYKRSNWVISAFRVCDSSTLDSLHRTYCMHTCMVRAMRPNLVANMLVNLKKIPNFKHGARLSYS